MDTDTPETAEVVASEATVETAAPAVTVEAPASSAEAVDEAPKTTLDVARDAWLKLHPKEDAPAVPAAKPEEAAAAPATTEPSKEQQPDTHRLTKEEYEALPPKAQHRMGYLSDQFKRTQKDLEAAFSKVSEYEASHQALTDFQEFAAEQGLTTDDVSNSLQHAGFFRRGEFEGFLNAVMPFVLYAQQATGKAFLPEVQTMVDNGEVTEEAGRRLTKAEIERQNATNKAKALEEAATAQTTANQQQQHIASVMKAARDTEAALAGDPNYALKAPALKKQITTLIANGWRPKTPKEAADTIRSTYENIMVNAPRPTPQATNPRPSASFRPAPAAPPKTTKEAVFQAWATRPGA